MDSMSPGFMFARGFGGGGLNLPVPLLKLSPVTPIETFLEIGNPSITYKGSFPPDIDPTPLTLICAPTPGSPETSVT